MPLHATIGEHLRTIPVKWQRMKISLEILARGSRSGASRGDLCTIASEALAIFVQPFEKHIPAGALVGDQMAQEATRNAARIETFLVGINRRAKAHAPPLEGQDVIADELADWIEARLRPVYRDKWKPVEILDPWAQTTSKSPKPSGRPGLKDDLGNAAAAAQKSEEIEFSDDYRSCMIGDKRYAFTVIQAACMRAIWELSKHGRFSFAQKSVIDSAAEWAKVGSKRLDHVFRKGRSRDKERYHPLWGTLIRRDPERAGHYQIVKP